MTQCAGELIEGDARCNGYHQGIFVQAGGDFTQHLNHDTWLHGAKDNICDLRDFLCGLRRIYAVLIVQCCDFIGRGGIDPDLSGEYLAAGDQAAKNRFTHISAADKTNFLVHLVTPYA